MALSVGTDLITLADCDTSVFSDGDLDSVMKIQGTDCIALQVKATTSAVVTLGITSADMTGKALFMWQQVSGLTDSKTNGGMRGYASDGTNAGTWHLGGGLDNLGWNGFVFAPASTITSGAQPDESAITSFGVQFKTLTTVVGSTTNNCFWDACRYGSYLQATSLFTDTVTIDDVYLVDSDSANAYGVLLKGKSGAYIQQAKIIYGSTVSGDCNFSDSGQIITFPDNPFIEAGFYAINVVGASGSTTNFTFTGSVLKSFGLPFILDASDTNIDTMALNGDTIVNCGSAKFSAGASITNNVFDIPGLIEPTTATFTGNTVTAATGNAVDIVVGHATANNNYKDNLISAPLVFNSIGTYTIDGDQFSGNIFDVENASTGLVTINVVGGSNLPSDTYTNTNGGTTVINNNVALTIGANVSLVGAEVRVYDQDSAQQGSHGTELAGVESNTTATFLYSGAAANVIFVQIMLAGYEEYGLELPMPNLDGGLTAILEVEVN